MIDKVKRGGNYGWSVMEGPQPVHVEGRRGPAPILPPIEGPPPFRGRLDHGRLRVSRDPTARAGRRLHLRRLSDRDRLVAPDPGGRGRRAQGAGPDAAPPRRVRRGRRRRAVPRRPRPDAPGLSPGPQPGGRGEERLPPAAEPDGAVRLDPRPSAGPWRDPLPVNAELWADGATAERFLAVPGDGRIGLDERGNWRLPEGSVLGPHRLRREATRARRSSFTSWKTPGGPIPTCGTTTRPTPCWPTPGARAGRSRSASRDRPVGRRAITASIRGRNASSATIPGSRRRRSSTACSRPRRWASTRPR